MVEAVASTPCAAFVFIWALKRAALLQAACSYKTGSPEFVSRLEYIHTYPSKLRDKLNGGVQLELLILLEIECIILLGVELLLPYIEAFEGTI